MLASPRQELEAEARAGQRLTVEVDLEALLGLDLEPGPAGADERAADSFDSVTQQDPQGLRDLLLRKLWQEADVEQAVIEHGLRTQLKPGKAAVVAEINEEWVTPVDTRMGALGGEVLRRARTEVVDAQVASEQAAMQEEIAELKAEAAKATGEAKSRLQKRVDAANARLQGLQSRAKTAYDADKQQMEAKLHVLQDRTARAKGEAKAGFQQRTEKLRKAWERTKEKWGSHASTDS